MPTYTIDQYADINGWAGIDALGSSRRAKGVALQREKLRRQCLSSTSRCPTSSTNAARAVELLSGSQIRRIVISLLSVSRFALQSSTSTQTPSGAGWPASLNETRVVGSKNASRKWCGSVMKRSFRSRNVSWLNLKLEACDDG